MTRTPRTSRLRRVPVRYRVLAVLAALAVVVTVALSSLGLASASTSAKDRIAADPPPALFSDSDIATTERQVTGQESRAHELMAQWWTSHGHQRDDSAFTSWAEQTLPGPPTTADRTAEVNDVAQLAGTRTTQGVAAATWLEVHGKKDVWKLYAHDQAELLPAREGDSRKLDVKTMLKMSKTIADSLGVRYRQSAPYVLRPSLRPDHTVAKGQVCPCSYPSRHASASAAATTYLSGLDPHRGADYVWTEAQVDWSRVYMAGHVPSDVTAGALLGDMIGEYFLESRA